MYSIIIPTYNEAAIIRETVDRLNSFAECNQLEVELIVADNGSTDGTPSIVRSLTQSASNVRLIELADRGPGRAFAEAVRNARGDWIITQDADLSSDLFFLKYVELLSGVADAVIGTKTFGRQRRKLHRVMASQFYVACAQLCFDVTQSDFSMGCKAFRREIIIPFLEKLDPWTGFIMDLAVLLVRDKRRVIQIGINCDDQRKGRFNLLHEGVFRFWHLWKVSKNLRN